MTSRTRDLFAFISLITIATYLLWYLVPGKNFIGTISRSLLDVFLFRLAENRIACCAVVYFTKYFVAEKPGKTYRNFEANNQELKGMFAFSKPIMWSRATKITIFRASSVKATSCRS